MAKKADEGFSQEELDILNKVSTEQVADADLSTTDTATQPTDTADTTAKATDTTAQTTDTTAQPTAKGAQTTDSAQNGADKASVTNESTATQKTATTAQNDATGAQGATDKSAKADTAKTDGKPTNDTAKADGKPTNDTAKTDGKPTKADTKGAKADTKSDKSKRDKSRPTSLSRQEENDIIKSKDIQAKMKYRKISKFIALALVLCLILTGGTWGVLYFIDYNNMKIVIGRDDARGLSLSSTSDFRNPTIKLNMKGPDKMDAITYQDIVITDNLGKEGSHSGAEYIAYTFFLKNMSEKFECDYNTSIVLLRNILDVDSAIRMMVMTTTADGASDINVYAKARDDNQSPEYVAYDSDIAETQTPVPLDFLNIRLEGFLKTNLTTPFEGIVQETKGSVYYINRAKVHRLQPHEVVKYTCILWLEGTDAQCKDKIRGGDCSISMQFDVAGYGDIEIA